MPKYTRICPQCNSIEIEFDKSNPVSLKYGLSNVYRCKRCGNTGVFFPEVKKVPELIPLEKVKKSDKVDKTFINFYGSLRKIWWKFSGIFLFVISLIIIFFSRTNKHLIYQGSASGIFYAGLIGFLPFSLAILAIAFKKELLEKYAILNYIVILTLIGSFTFLPILAYQFAINDKLNFVDRSQYDPLITADYTPINKLKPSTRAKISGTFKSLTTYDNKTVYYLKDDTGRVKLYGSSQVSKYDSVIFPLREKYSTYLGKQVEIWGYYSKNPRIECNFNSNFDYCGFVVNKIKII